MILDQSCVFMYHCSFQVGSCKACATYVGSKVLSMGCLVVKKENMFLGLKMLFFTQVTIGWVGLVYDMEDVEMELISYLVS